MFITVQGSAVALLQIQDVQENWEIDKSRKLTIIIEIIYVSIGGGGMRISYTAHLLEKRIATGQTQYGNECSLTYYGIERENNSIIAASIATWPS